MKVFAIVPAHNEEDYIEENVYSLLMQTYPVEKVVVVADNCDDNTVERVRKIEEKFSQVCCIESLDNMHKKAGAINGVLDLIEEEECDVVIIMDGDSVLSMDLLEKAMDFFWEDSDIGGVCSTAYTRKPKRWPLSLVRRMEAKFLWRIQKLEYGGFDAERTATWQSVTILHGLCGVYRLKALKEVGGYALGHLIEDYDLTLCIKEAGWKTKFNPKMKAWTEVPLTFRAFFRQRLRWMRGGVDTLLDHGFNRFTAEDIIHHFLFVLLFLAIIGFTSILVFQGGWAFRFNPHPIPIAVMIVGYFSGIYKLKYVEMRDFWDIIIRATIIPELLLAIIFMGVRIYVYYLALFGRPQEW